MTDRLLTHSALAVLALALVAGCATTKGGGAASGAAPPDPSVGQPLPTIELTDLATGQPVSIAETGGRVVLVDFWATWCDPCMKSLPVYETWIAELGGQGFAVVAVSVDQAGAPVADYAARLAPSAQVLLDPEGVAPSALQLPALPVAYLLGRDGVVRSRHLGFHTADAPALKAEIEVLLAEPVP